MATDKRFRERFEREARAVARLRHPNIVQVYDFDFSPEERLYCMVMGFIDGPTLRQRLDDLAARGRLPPMDEAVRIGGLSKGRDGRPCGYSGVRVGSS